MTRNEAHKQVEEWIDDKVEIEIDKKYNNGKSYIVGTWHYGRMELHRDIDKIFNDHEAQLKAKDEEIEQSYNLGYRNGYSDAYNASEMCKLGFVKPFERIDKKSRSIVAMLFWEWRNAVKVTNEKTIYSDEYSDADYWYLRAKEESFQQAYKMLKERK